MFNKNCLCFFYQKHIMPQHLSLNLGNGFRSFSMLVSNLMPSHISNLDTRQMCDNSFLIQNSFLGCTAGQRSHFEVDGRERLHSSRKYQTQPRPGIWCFFLFLWINRHSLYILHIVRHYYKIQDSDRLWSLLLYMQAGIGIDNWDGYFNSSS